MVVPSFDREDILRTYHIFHVSGDVVEMRIPHAGRYKTISGYFNEAGTLVDCVVISSLDRPTNTQNMPKKQQPTPISSGGNGCR